jgi:hypothetical protein
MIPLLGFFLDYSVLAVRTIDQGVYKHAEQGLAGRHAGPTEKA